MFIMSDQKELEQKISDVRKSGDYMCNTAIDRGLTCSFSYHPRTKSLRELFELGLQKWLQEHSIDGAIAPQISDPAILKGFIYMLRAGSTGHLNLLDKGFVTFEQEEVCKRELDIILKEYEGLETII